MSLYPLAVRRSDPGKASDPLEKRAISVRVVPADGGRSLEWAVSRTTLLALGVTGFLLVALLGFLLTRAGDLARRAEEADRLVRRNAELEESLQKVAALERELVTMRALDREIRGWAGLPAEPAAARESPGAPSAPGASSGEQAFESARGLGEETGGALVAPPALDARAAGIDPEAVAGAHPLRWPVDGWVSSEFGEARGTDGPHSGIDIVAVPGSAVVAAAGGRVSVAGSDAELGRVVVIDHGNGLFTYYGHNAEIAVRAGDAVGAGQKVASVGSTGRSSAPHLHFEVRQDGCALDPRAFLPPAR